MNPRPSSPGVHKNSIYQDARYQIKMDYILLFRQAFLECNDLLLICLGMFQILKSAVDGYLEYLYLFRLLFDFVFSKP